MVVPATAADIASWLEIVREVGMPMRGGVIHCFTGDAAAAREFLALGFCISFSGILTFKNAAVIRDAATIVLRLARESGQASKVMAMQGSYQQMLSGRTYQLMQVRVPSDTRLIPEASANKYMLWVRFTVQDGDLRPRAVDVDVPFQLTLCSL